MPARVVSIEVSDNDGVAVRVGEDGGEGRCVLVWAGSGWWDVYVEDI